MMFATFDENGDCTSVAIDFKNPGAIQMPDGFTSTLARRYTLTDPVYDEIGALVGGDITDLHAGKDDEQIFAEERAAAEAAAAAARRAKVVAGFPDSLDGKKRAYLKLIRDHFNGVIAAIKADVAPHELETWDVQRADLERWMANPDAPTPYVDGLCAARGLTKEALMNKIKAKVTALATLQGTQRSYEDLVKDAETIEDVLAITLPS